MPMLRNTLGMSIKNNYKAAFSYLGNADAQENLAFRKMLKIQQGFGLC